MPPTDADTPAERSRAHAMLTAAMALGVALRAHALGGLSLYYDELYATRIYGLTPRNVAGVVARTAFYDQHPPLYYLSALAWTQVFGLSEGAVRGLSALAGVLVIPATYVLGRELAGRGAAAWGALLASTFPLLVYFSREARMYEQLALLATLSTWLLVRMARGDRPRWITPAWLVVTTATALSHYFGAVHVFAEFVVLALRGRRGARDLPAWAALFAVPFAAFVPFAVFAQYQSQHFDSSYLGFGATVYADVLAWLGGAHQRLPVALVWTLPFLALVARGVAASWRAQGPAWVAPFAPPPPSSRLSRALAALTALGAFAVAAGLFALRQRIADKVAAVEVDRGETLAIALLQGRTALHASLLGAVAAGFAALGLALRNRLARPIEATPAPVDGEAFDPVGSLARVALVCVALPLALSLVVGLAGKPIVVVRNFIPAAPLLALLAGRGLTALRPPLRLASAAAALGVALFVASRIGALPGVDASDDVRLWTLHTYHDWRRVEALTRGDTFAPLVAVQHYATDAVIHYRGHHPVLRVSERGGRLVVTQVRQDDDYDVEVHEGDPFHPELLTQFYLVDVAGLAHDGGASRRLLDAARANHDCAVRGALAGGVTVYDCSAATAVALRAR